ncbi:MAG: hypothetical protein ACRENE_31220 [Polyangiaceae bacterium]
MTKRFGLRLGFGPIACAELAIVASELSSNIVKYGKGGHLEVGECEEHGLKGIVLTAHDADPPFRSFEAALEDGADDAGPIHPDLIHRHTGLASGLGAVARMTHSVRLEVEANGKRVVATRYLDKPLTDARYTARKGGPQG